PSQVLGTTAGDEQLAERAQHLLQRSVTAICRERHSLGRLAAWGHGTTEKGRLARGAKATAPGLCNSGAGGSMTSPSVVGSEGAVSQRLTPAATARAAAQDTRQTG